MTAPVYYPGNLYRYNGQLVRIIRQFRGMVWFAPDGGRMTTVPAKTFALYARSAHADESPAEVAQRGVHALVSPGGHDR